MPNIVFEKHLFILGALTTFCTLFGAVECKEVGRNLSSQHHGIRRHRLNDGKTVQQTKSMSDALTEHHR